MQSAPKAVFLVFVISTVVSIPLAAYLYSKPFGSVLSLTNHLAHPGNTAADDCHYCRTNCDKWGVPWGERHCHGSYQVPDKNFSNDFDFPTFTSKATVIPTSTPQIQNSLKADSDDSATAAVIAIGVIVGASTYFANRKKNK